jgi:hypothetical protein
LARDWPLISAGGTIFRCGIRCAKTSGTFAASLQLLIGCGFTLENLINFNEFLNLYFY